MTCAATVWRCPVGTLAEASQGDWKGRRAVGPATPRRSSATVASVRNRPPWASRHPAATFLLAILLVPVLLVVLTLSAIVLRARVTDGNDRERNERSAAGFAVGLPDNWSMQSEVAEEGESFFFSRMYGPSLRQVLLAPGDVETVKAQVVAALAATGFRADDWFDGNGPDDAAVEEDAYAAAAGQQVRVTVASKLRYGLANVPPAPAGSLLVDVTFSVD